MAVRLQVSERLLLVGLVPEVAVAESVVAFPAVTGFTEAVPVAVGGVETLLTTKLILKLLLRGVDSVSATLHGIE